jgi:beta-aspartyl-peptidase (threonine type)
MENRYAIALHGGAGVIEKSEDPELISSYEAALAECLQVGTSLLQNGATSLDAVEAVVAALEDNPLFNAGRGAVFNHDGFHELEASIMNGKNMSCGATSGIKTVKNPIKLARKVMENTSHVWLAGKGAEKFAREQDLECVEQSYYFTQRRYNQYLEALKEGKVMQDHSGGHHHDLNEGTDKKGTVGCVAIDRWGDLAAATSTGGRTNKMVGRVGDSPVIGAGTYANNHTCAVSGTGWGEKFIRSCVAHHINCLMEYKDMSIQEASEFVVHKKLDPDDGGVVCVSKNYEIAMPYNTLGMFRASSSHRGDTVIKIWE